MPVLSATSNPLADQSKAPKLNYCLDLTTARVAMTILSVAAPYAAAYCLSQLGLGFTPYVLAANATVVAVALAAIYLYSTQPQATAEEGSVNDAPPTNVDLTPYVERQLAEDPDAHILKNVQERIEKMEYPNGKEIADIKKLLETHPNPKSLAHMLLICKLATLQDQYDFLPLSKPIDHETDSQEGRWLQNVRNLLDRIDDPWGIKKKELQYIRMYFERCTGNVHRREYNRLKILLERIEEIYYKKAGPREEVPGEIIEDDFGDCAVLALARLLNGDKLIDHQLQQQQANALRRNAVALMRKYWITNKKLKGWIRNDIIEHNSRKIENCKNDIRITENNSLPHYKQLLEYEKQKGSKKDKDLIQYLNTLITELEINCARQTEEIDEREEINSRACSDDNQTLSLVINQYLEEISIPGAYLGGGALMVIGLKNRTLIHINRPAGNNADGTPKVSRDKHSMVLLTPEDFAKGYDREVDVIRRGPHYNSYFPPDDGAGVGHL